MSVAPSKSPPIRAPAIGSAGTEAYESITIHPPLMTVSSIRAMATSAARIVLKSKMTFVRGRLSTQSLASTRLRWT